MIAAGLRSRLGHALLNVGARLLGDPLERDVDDDAPISPHDPTPSRPERDGLVESFRCECGHLASAHAYRGTGACTTWGCGCTAYYRSSLPARAVPGPDEFPLQRPLLTDPMPLCACGHPYDRHQFSVRVGDIPGTLSGGMSFAQSRCVGGASTCPCDSYQPDASA